MSKHEHHFEFLKSAIRRRDAACMIGAGFSLNAESVNGGPNNFPLWNGVIEKLVVELYPNTTEENLEWLKTHGSATSGAMRLAEEFEAAFGRGQLNQMIEKVTPDLLHDPSEHHRSLLRLEWSDIFTTNYDTLLERAAREPDLSHRRYRLVTKIGDLPHSRSPRIIKLHGSMPDAKPYIFTEEDFRTYPTKYAPFVNEVRVSIMEKTFCLLGFSGNDPNFLAWTGWVRDQLQEDAPKIYWIDVDGDIEDFQLSLLRSRNIVQLDLRSIYDEENRGKALQNFLNDMQRAKQGKGPRWNWSPLVSSEFRFESTIETTNKSGMAGKDELIQAIECWSKSRADYLGWHILPVRRIGNLWDYTRYWGACKTFCVSEIWLEICV